MADIDDRILQSILTLTGDVSAMRADLTTFLRDQNTMKGDITAVRSDISELKREVHQIKATDARRKSFIGGIVAAWSAVWTGVMVFIWPYIKEKIGL
ncbi:PspA/IM30 family protein [Allorhizobium undicola]|uniref:hypothetical protein n=1 Tax=Allorhizobium undicola TaxID=78527 RepID=UPI0004838D71|nr:hypothetical protein [Allorhizobium undicola]